MADFPFRPSRYAPHTFGSVSAGQLWKHVPPERRTAAAQAFWADKNASAQADAMAEMAGHLKFRPKSVQALPIEKKVRYLVSMPSLSDSVAGHVLVAYHIATKRPMMAAFLDQLGIKHEDGVIAEKDLKAPAPGRLDAAVKELFDEYPHEDVELYLSTLLVQDRETWGGLAAVLDARAEGDKGLSAET
jgi:hypothetical protein